MWEDFEMTNNGILYKNSEKDPQGNTIFQIVAPQIIRDKVLESLHNSRLSGHLGRDKTYEAVRRRFYWPGMANDVKLWCQSCDFCARRKPGPWFGKSPLLSSLLQST